MWDCLKHIKPPALKHASFLPPLDVIYRAFDLCPENGLKAVILGQDPYCMRGVSDGLAFSSARPGFCPASLRNMINELGRTHEVTKTTFTLDEWAKQGVLLLNMALTVEEGRPNSHKSLWLPYTSEIIKTLGQRTDVVWGLLGSHARLFKTDIKGPVVVVGHPSPLNRTYPFVTSGFFVKMDKAMEELGHDLIDWSR